MTTRKTTSRRAFLRSAALGTVGGLVLPSFIPRTYLFGADQPPSRRVQVAQIGVGRMGSGDMGGVLACPLARVVAVCDLDAKRLAAARDKVVEHYRKAGEQQVAVAAHGDYRDVLARADIDAVVVSVPDHWHAQIAVEAVLAGKDVYVQKPMTYTIAESIALRTATRAKKRVLQVGSQLRSIEPFRRVTELARNGAIGKIHAIKVSVGRDKPSGRKPAPEPVPATLDYQRWLGPAPEQPYMEGRVHPQGGYDRPGWITTEDFGLGMITNWGTHALDLAQWGMGMELSGPTSIEARAEFMQGDQWTVHTGYHAELGYPNGAQVIVDDAFDNGIRFEGDGGWLFCSRIKDQVTASDPGILATALPTNAQRWMPSSDHYANWLQCVLDRRDPVAPVDQGARTLTTCVAAWIGMKLGRKLAWDPLAERFIGDEQANALCSRKPRHADYDLAALMTRAGL
jgi:myo-inositol 2-dehydrogenase / D-chiro-inositol 1-dehydrogenase